MERSHPKGVKPNMRGAQIKKWRNLQVAIKARGVKQDVAKTRVGCVNVCTQDGSILFYA
jgi:hypothetical protein